MQYAYKNMMWSSQFNLPDMYYVYLIALYNQILYYLEPFSMYLRTKIKTLILKSVII